MTILASRPILRVNPAPDRPARPVILASALAAALCAAAGLVATLALAVAGWFAADVGSFPGAIRVGALAWLVAQGSGLTLEAGTGGTALTLTAIPLGGVLLAGWLLHRAGRWVGDRAAPSSLRRAAVGTAVLTVTYPAIGALVAVVATPAHAHAPLLRTALVLALIALVFGGLGIVCGAQVQDDLLAPLPAEVRAGLTGAVGSFLAMITMAAVAFAVGMVHNFGSAVRVAEGLDAGVVGAIVIALVGLAAVPNAVLFAGAYLAGPGFVLGAGSTVTPHDVHLGLLPSLPVLAATPRGAGPWWVDGLLCAPFVAGAVGGILVVRRSPSPTLGISTAVAAAAGVSAGVAFGAATWLATGSIGPGRMHEVGPRFLATGAVCAVGFAVGGAVAAGGLLLWRRWRDADAPT